MKMKLKGGHFETIEKIINKSQASLQDVTESVCKESISSMEREIGDQFTATQEDYFKRYGNHGA